MTRSSHCTLAAIVCTHSPPSERLVRVLRALSRSREFDEIVIVRNGGAKLDTGAFQDIPQLKWIEEEKLGLVYARAAGIRASNSQLVAFVDDDNVVDEAYSHEAKRFWIENRQLGVFGGRITGSFERRPAIWKRPALPFLGLRDLGSEAIIVASSDKPNFDVPGAGFVVRRDVADHFADAIANGHLGGLGRRGADLASGDDTAICRLARQMGASLGYTPSLHLTHIIPGARTEFRYLVALIERIGRSAAKLDEIFESRRTVPSVSGLVFRHLYHLIRHGPIGWATAGWHRGYRSQSAKRDHK
ncbi:MAG: glycosyltransferase [Ahrensia sp.]|nr:glycosyltransferase [Ahrensia sp.]